MTFLPTNQTVDGRCLVCGTQNAACGGSSATVGVDERMEVAAVGGPLRKYRYSNGTNTTVLKLNDMDAEQFGLTEADLVDVASPAAEMKAARPAQNKARGGAANKARSTATTKGRGAKSAPTDPGDGGAGGGN